MYLVELSVDKGVRRTRNSGRACSVLVGTGQVCGGEGTMSMQRGDRRDEESDVGASPPQSTDPRNDTIDDRYGGTEAW